MKRMRPVDSRDMYRRYGSETIYVRDESGRYNTYTIEANRVRILPGAITTLGPIYGRVDFSNGVRFTGRTRSQTVLQEAFDQTPPTQIKATQWVALPAARESSRRTPNQGMNAQMIALTGVTRSANEYLIWYHTDPNFTHNKPWEWCHLLAHSMGGADNPTNIVAARKGNNSEQLAIESALQMYRMEQLFEMQISAACVDAADGVSIGDVIRYDVRCTLGGDHFLIYLDCKNAPNPSQIHYYGVLQSVAKWANRKLVQASTQIFNNPVSAEDKRRIMDYIDRY